jgi:exodeoxyribonuclease VII large subunit
VDAVSGRADGLLPPWDSAHEEPESVARRPAPAPPGTFGQRVRTVSEVARTVKDAVRTDERLRDLWIEGEVGRVTISSAGHAYFTLKDDRSALQCVWFRDDRVRSAFQPQTGLRVVTHGRMDVYEPSGALQLYVDALQPSGFGDLAIRFEQLKARLGAEGLFESARKRPLPSRPSTVAVVTSPSGAVWRDVCHVLARRWPLVRVVLVACQVQGEGAPASIVGALRRLERLIAEGQAAGGDHDDVPSVTILARGGGSLEDLWSFNDERVVRAVVAHTIPVVCGVGHEVDVTLADFAADVRAPTPSAAAELVVPDRVEVAAGVAAARRRLDRSAERSLVAAGRELATERRALERADPAAQLAAARERAGLLLDRATRALAADVGRRRSTVDRLGDRLGPTVPGRLVRERERLERTAERLGPLLPARLAREHERLDRAAGRLPVLAGARLGRARSSLDAASAALAVLGPQATLDRGYAIVRRADDGAIVRDPSEARRGTSLRLRVARGELVATSDGEPAGRSDGA